MTQTTAAAVNPDHAFLIGMPKKSRYQFFVHKDQRSGVAQTIRAIIPTYNGKPDPKKSLVFGYDHPYTGWAGFNLPGVFEIRKKIAMLLFSQGWKLGVAVELPNGGLSPIMNKHDHTGTKELPDNTGGCAGCANKNPENCGPCILPYKYGFGGKKIAKPAYDRNTIWTSLKK